jgi:predicted alpha/beta-fold hydrolase
MLSEETIKCKNRKFHFINVGKGDTSLLVLHGLAGNKEIMVPFTQLLRDKYKCIYLDLPGHNGLPLNNIDSVSDFADYIKSFIEAMKLKDFGILGFSYGGNIALEYGNILSKTKQVPIVTWATPAQGLVQRMPKALLNIGYFLPKPFWKNQILFNLLSKLGINFSVNDLDAMYKVDKKLLKISSKLLSEKVNCPEGLQVLNILDPTDPFVKPDSSSSSKSILIKGGGHFGKKENVNESLRQISAFFDESLK